MAAEQLGPGASVGNTALARRLADADAIVDHQDPEAAVHRDTYLDAGGVGMPSDIGQGFSEDGDRFELHHQRDDAVVYAMGRDFRFAAEALGRVRHRFEHPGPQTGAGRSFEGEYGFPDLFDGGIEVVDGGRDPGRRGLVVDQSQRALQAQAGSEQPLDNEVVKVAGDASRSAEMSRRSRSERTSASSKAKTA